MAPPLKSAGDAPSPGEVVIEPKNKKRKTQQPLDEVKKKRKKAIGQSTVDEDASLSLQAIVEDGQSAVEEDPNKGGEDDEHEATERRKASYFGHAPNVNTRHVEQLRSLSCLTRCHEMLKSTRKKMKIFEFPCRHSTNKLYMEWDKKEDCYYLWCRAATGIPLIKFQFHGGFEVSPCQQLSVDNPILAFSNSFTHGSGWLEVKKFLEECFGPKDARGAGGANDYVLAFTRVTDVVHFRIFKIHVMPTLEVKNMKLEEISLSFMLKPISLHNLPQAGSKECPRTMSFFDEHSLIMKRSKDLNLEPSDVLYEKSSSDLHDVHMPSELCRVILLPLPAYRAEWLDLNTNFEEFFERYHVFRSTSPVPGTGKIPKPWPAGDPTPAATSDTNSRYDELTVTMKVFVRELIIAAGEPHKSEMACFDEIREENIFVGHGRVAILNVNLLPYTRKRAKKNFRDVYDILQSKIAAMLVPQHLKVALGLLYKTPVEDHVIVANNFAWMDPDHRLHMVEDLYVQFMSHLSANAQATVAFSLPDRSNWENKFKQNWLLHDVLIDRLPKIRTGESVENWRSRLVTYRANKAADLRGLLTDPNDADVLHEGRSYFGGTRNSYVHLPEVSEKILGASLAIAEVDAVVGSQLGEVCSKVQIEVPKAFTATDPARADYGRFQRYFQGAEFDPVDEK